MLTYTKISPKMVNPRDLARNTEEDKEDNLKTTFQAPGSAASGLGLLLPVSTHLDWVKQQICPATSVSMGQFIELFKRTLP